MTNNSKYKNSDEFLEINHRDKDIIYCNFFSGLFMNNF